MEYKGRKYKFDVKDTNEAQMWQQIIATCDERMKTNLSRRVDVAQFHSEICVDRTRCHVEGSRESTREPESLLFCHLISLKYKNVCAFIQRGARIVLLVKGTAWQV